MATFPSLEAFRREVEQMERDLERRYPVVGAKVGKLAQGEGYRAAAGDLGGDPKFSGWRPWLELQVRPKKYGAAVIPTRYSAGPWTVAQHGRNTMQGFGNVRRTRDGDVRTLKSGRVSVRKAKRWNGVTAGKGTADKAQARFDTLAEKVGEMELRVVTRRHFD